MMKNNSNIITRREFLKQSVATTSLIVGTSMPIKGLISKLGSEDSSKHAEGPSATILMDSGNEYYITDVEAEYYFSVGLIGNLFLKKSFNPPESIYSDNFYVKIFKGSKLQGDWTFPFSSLHSIDFYDWPLRISGGKGTFSKVTVIKKDGSSLIASEEVGWTEVICTAIRKNSNNQRIGYAKGDGLEFSFIHYYKGTPCPYKLGDYGINRINKGGIVGTEPDGERYLYYTSDIRRITFN